jgi:hypothetical protein
LERKYAAILAYESARAHRIAVAIVEKPALSVWLILVPILFLHYMHRHQKFKAGVEACAREILSTRRQALEAARAQLSGDAPTALSNPAPATEKAEAIRSAQAQEVILLERHYERLLQVDGEDYDTLVARAYPEESEYASFLQLLQHTEQEVNRRVLEASGDTPAAADLVSRLEEAQREVSMQEARRVFGHASADGTG